MAGLTAAVRSAAAYKKFYVGAATVVLGACSTTAPPVSELAAARAAVATAQPVAAQEAPTVIASAQDKLAHAERAMQLGEHLHAKLFAEQAEADAKLALAAAHNARAQRATAQEAAQGK